MSSAKTLNILLAEKELSYLEDAKKMLKFHDENLNLEVATTREECLNKINSNKIDLVLLDYNVDDSNALDVLDQIYAEHDLPVIMLLDEGQEDVAIKAMEQGASDYIMKVRGYLTALPNTAAGVLKQFKINGKRKFKYISKHQTTVEGAGEQLFFMLDRKSHFLSTNPKIEELLEYSEAELLALALSDLIPPESENKYNHWINSFGTADEIQALRTEIVCKYGKRKEVEISLSPIKKADGEISSYKGKIILKHFPKKRQSSHISDFDQGQMIQEMLSLINSSYDDSLNHLLNRITNAICHLFKFKRATLALLDRRRKVFVKQTMVGYINQGGDGNVLEVPQDIIDKAFAEQYKIKVMFFEKNLETMTDSSFLSMTDRRSQPRRKDGMWHPKDYILLNLIDQNYQTFGYISLDNPEFEDLPSRNFFYNLELFANLASLAIKNYYRLTSIEKRNRRLVKQLLITNNIFKLNQNLSEILNEFVWSVKFSLEFNLVVLALISVNSGKIEVKSVACEDKIKKLQLQELKFPIDKFRMLAQKKYRKGKLYYIDEEEDVLKSLKEIYYRSRTFYSSKKEVGSYWPSYAMLVVPIRSSQENKIRGFLMLDDPADYLIPSQDALQILEILANQISVAIENRLSYLEAKDGRIENTATSELERVEYNTGIMKFVNKYFK